MTELALPDPRGVTSDDIIGRLVPLVQAARIALVDGADMAGLDDLRRRLEAFGRYVTVRDGRYAVAAETRRTEVQIGHLLGPGERGRAINTLASVIAEDDRYKFRQLAEHERLVEELLAAMIVTRRQILSEIRFREHVPAGTPAMPAPGAYQCVVIDPPWPMRNINREVRDAQSPVLDYPVMSLDEIAKLPVGDLAASDCHLYLWVTHHFLPAGLDLLTAWGFHYECVMTWRKNVGITPFSWMYDTEHVLFARRGSLDLTRKGLRLSFDAPVTGHSVKPDVFYERVTAASPGPRLDMFARRQRDGFAAWGNEVCDA